MSELAEKNQTAQAASNLSALLDISSSKPQQFGAQVFVKIGILAALFLLLHVRQIDWLVRSWVLNSNWSHGFLIPLFSLYLLYVRRQEIASVPRKACWTGLVIMLLSLGVEVLAIPLFRDYWILNLGMVAMLFGLVLYLGGTKLMRLLWLPILFLTLSVPVPESLYVRAAYPLQEIAARGAVVILNIFGVEISRQASNITLFSRSGLSHDLTVAEACSGMRLLMAFFALGVATAYLESRPVWQRVVLVLAALPIAVFCNVLRVAITATMYYIDKPELGQNVLHSFTGMLMLIPAFGMLFGLGWILHRLFVEVPEPTSATETGAGE